MPIGNPVDTGGLNARLGDVAVSWRDTALLSVKLWSFILTLGANQAAQVAALQAAPFNMSPVDAQNFWTAANAGFALSQVYFGNQSQAQFNFDNALAAARGAS